MSQVEAFEVGSVHKSPEEMIDFLKRSVVVFLPDTIEKLESLDATSLRCVDDRDDGSAERIAVAGAGLGVLIDVFAGLKIAKADLEPKNVVETFITEFGLPSYHTDEYKKGESLCCAGCGHCNGVFSEPEKFGISAGTTRYFRDEFLPYLANETRPTVYRGEHKSEATVVVEGLDVGLVASQDGVNVFVYQPDWHAKFLDSAAESFSPETDIPADTLSEIFRSVATTNLQNTLDKLASDLPTYHLRSDNGEIAISQ